MRLTLPLLLQPTNGRVLTAASKAAYPLPYVREAKFWPSVSRVDNAYGDRNLVCSCLPIEEYAKETVA